MCFLQFNDETMIPPYEIFTRKSVKTLVSPFFYLFAENIPQKHNQQLRINNFCLS